MVVQVASPEQRAIVVTADDQFLGVNRCPFHVSLPCGPDKVNEGMLDGLVIVISGTLHYVGSERYLQVVGGHRGVALVKAQ